MRKSKGGAGCAQFLFVILASLSFLVYLFHLDPPPLLRSNNVIHSQHGHGFPIPSIPTSQFVEENRSKGDSPNDQKGKGEDPVHETEEVVTDDNVPSDEKESEDVGTDDNVASDEKESEDVNVDDEKEPDREDPCSGKYIYVHNIPSKFNSELLKNCKTISPYEDMCSQLSNEGFGPKIRNRKGVLTDKGWFNTHLYVLDVIFHNKMKQYKCLTNNSSLASAIYVPFYAGLDIFRYLWGGISVSTRDSTSHSLLKWLVAQPEWKVLGGRDHFLVSGRATAEHRRRTNEESDWGNNLLFMPEAKNMTMLLPAASPWHWNDFAIPYPSYFHPSTDEEVVQWQNRMKRLRKKHLFCFVGNPRPKQKGAIRNQLIEHCKGAKRKCKLLQCGKGELTCHDPSAVIQVFQSSVFCLQPPGDDPTRRSTFDSLLAGCIPVLFHPASAYVQYTWHLPKDYTKYSVYIPEDAVRNGTANILSILSRIPKERVRAMRNEVIRLIPKLMYTYPGAKMGSMEDACDIALKGVIEKVNGVRNELKERLVSDEKRYGEGNFWKYNLFGRVQKHEWDDFFM